MRVTNSMIARNLIRNLNRNLRELERYNEQLSSGKLLRVPSDDPASVRRSMELRSQRVELHQYVRNMNDARAWLEATEGSLAEVTEMLNRARELAVYGATGSLTAQDRVLLAHEVEAILEHVREIANSKLGDRFLFSGQAVTSKPFPELVLSHMKSVEIYTGANGSLSGIQDLSQSGLQSDRYQLSTDARGIIAAVTDRFAGFAQAVFTDVGDLPDKTMTFHFRVGGQEFTVNYTGESGHTTVHLASALNDAFAALGMALTAYGEKETVPWRGALGSGELVIAADPDAIGSFEMWVTDDIAGTLPGEPTAFAPVVAELDVNPRQMIPGNYRIDLGWTGGDAINQVQWLSSKTDLVIDATAADDQNKNLSLALEVLDADKDNGTVTVRFEAHVMDEYGRVTTTTGVKELGSDNHTVDFGGFIFDNLVLIDISNFDPGDQIVINAQSHSEIIDGERKQVTIWRDGEAVMTWYFSPEALEGVNPVDFRFFQMSSDSDVDGTLNSSLSVTLADGAWSSSAFDSAKSLEGAAAFTVTGTNVPTRITQIGGSMTGMTFNAATPVYVAKSGTIAVKAVNVDPTTGVFDLEVAWSLYDLDGNLDEGSDTIRGIDVSGQGGVAFVDINGFEFRLEGPVARYFSGNTALFAVEPGNLGSSLVYIDTVTIGAARGYPGGDVSISFRDGGFDRATTALQLLQFDENANIATGNLFLEVTTLRTASRAAQFQVSAFGYAGDTGRREVEVVPGVTLPINIRGDEAFGPVFAALRALYDALMADDAEAIGSAVLGAIDEATDVILGLRAEAGGKLQRLDMATERMLDLDLTVRRMQSEIEDVDLAKAIVEFKMLENVYQASLATGARIIQPSLIDFLR